MKKGCRIIMFSMALKGRHFAGLSTRTLLSLESRSRIDSLTKKAWQHYLDCYYASSDFLQSPKFNSILVRDALV